MKSNRGIAPSVNTLIAFIEHSFLVQAFQDGGMSRYALKQIITTHWHTTTASDR
jgi:hypothetical protein